MPTESSCATSAPAFDNLLYLLGPQHAKHKKTKPQRKDVQELRQMGVEGTRVFELKLQGLGLGAYGSGHTAKELKCIGSRVPEAHMKTTMYMVVAGERSISQHSQAQASG